ncbi:MAG TPA: helix-turn-helix domain-containing protein [Candidatus Aquilonibacter sp.]|nr:helix-turn-helix domain-containing protein [Candidatus Aquilonibacter sp.]
MDADTPEVSLARRRRSSGFDPITEIEPFVKPEFVGEYLGINPATVVRFAKSGIIPGHPLRVSGHRMHWRFLLSEVRRVMLAKEPKLLTHAGTEERP